MTVEAGRGKDARLRAVMDIDLGALMFFGGAITCFLMGMQSVGTGILAELIVRTYFESQGKTACSIASRVGFETDNVAPRVGLDVGI
jgi:hypothetical protein